MPKKIFIATIFLGILVLTTGCTTMSDPETAQEYAGQVVGTLGPQQTIGQSFISRRPRLDGITIWVSNPNPTTSATLQADILVSADSPDVLFTTTIEISPASIHTPLYIQIFPQSSEPQIAYYLELSSDAPLQIDGRGEDAYAQGAAYFNGQPINADLAFRTTYRYGFSALLNDLQSWASQSHQIIIFLFLITLPGYLLLELFGLRPLFSISERVALSVGCSLSMIPVTMLWSTTLGFHWDATRVRLVAWSLLALALLLALFSRRRQRPAIVQDKQQMDQSTSRLTGIILGGVFLLALAARFAMVRDLAAPAWVDSIHHGLITRLILEQGAFPTTYLPYLAVDPHVYHPGFHSIVAMFSWLTSLDIGNSLSIAGQTINAAAVLAVFLFTKTQTQDSRAGLIAALITGFLTPMPAYLASWGRFTHLAGLVILPTLVALLHRAIQAKQPDRLRLVVASSLVAAGLFLVHYRVLAFAILLIIVIYLIRVAAQILRRQNTAIKINLLTIGFTGALASLVTLPWLLPFLRSILLPRIATAATVTLEPFADFSWRLLSAAYGKQALALAILGLIWAFIQKKSFAATIVLWVAGLLLLANLGALGLPGNDLVNNTSVAISLFIPISAGAGYWLAQWATAWETTLPRRRRPLFTAGLILAAILIAFSGAQQLLPILNPTTILARQADLDGMAWINQNTPADATFLINPFPWGYGIYAGQDGGFWISPLTGRLTIPAPVLSGMQTTSQSSQAIAFAQAVSASAQDAQSLWMLLRQQDIQYIYIGARGGVLSPQTLRSSSLFSTLYSQDNVWVFQVLP